jgi:small subunit ribosomal protein S25e
MPGKKSLKKLEKQQATKERESKVSKERTDKIIGALEIPDTSSEEVIQALKSMKAITPTGVAGKFNLKVSVAKKMLEELREGGAIHLAAKSHNLKVYAFPRD